MADSPALYNSLAKRTGSRSGLSSILTTSVKATCHRPPYESHSSSAKRSHREFGQVEPGQFGEAEPPWFGQAEPRDESSWESDLMLG